MPQQSAQQAPAPQRDTLATPSPISREIQHPLENLTLQETLRVMDVAREMRENRQSAEEMFRRDDLRANLRAKLMRTARMSGDNVTEAEIDAAIGQYMERLHTFEEPEAGLGRFMAHVWVWRARIATGLVAASAVAGAFWFMFA
ncbi:DUF6384 family protein [Rubripirellula amarantea]|nr:DUF6384 family protein [Rubripirellula amarantea]MDA8745182.1 DUF6384 family protein [Rubripirellula amarantea]